MEKELEQKYHFVSFDLDIFGNLSENQARTLQRKLGGSITDDENKIKDIISVFKGIKDELEYSNLN